MPNALSSPFSSLLCDAARAVIEPLLSRSGDGQVVAFDADGTLWRGDVGEDFLRHLICEDLLPRHKGERGLYDEYERRVARDPASAYAYAVEVMADLEETFLAQSCQSFFTRRFQGRIFRFAGPLISSLTRAGYVPWVVSASPWWTVVPGAGQLGIPPERVIGVRCEVREGRLTDQVSYPVPCGEGKVARLQAAGLLPVLALGNGELDLPMLAAAGTAVVVSPHGDPGNGLVAEARLRGWPIQAG